MLWNSDEIELIHLLDFILSTTVVLYWATTSL